MDGMVLFGAVRFGMAVMAGYVSVRLVWVRRSRYVAVGYVMVGLGLARYAKAVEARYGETR